MTDLRRDARLRELHWRDLTTLTPTQKVVEVLISAPWCILAIVSFDHGWFAVGAVSSFMFFLTGLRQAHGAQNSTLGIPRPAQTRCSRSSASSCFRACTRSRRPTCTIIVMP